MSKKFFVVSDIHSFAAELKKALKTAGFDKQNNEHILVVVGDFFDRGHEAIKLYKFITSIPKSRRILIRGNHEQLYLELLTKDYPSSHDFHNGTVDTFCQIAGVDYIFDYIRTSEHLQYVSHYNYEDVAEKSSLWEDIRNKVADSKITKWLKSDEWKNYYELDKFIFVHSFIPTKLKQECIDKYGINAYGFENPECFDFDPNWRESNNWDMAAWGCPWEQYKAGLFKPEEDAGKVLVCGHWHTSDFYKNLKYIDSYDGYAPIYFSRGLIGLDGGVSYNYRQCTYSHPQNVLVIDENFNCYDAEGNKLKEPAANYRIETVSAKNN